MPTRDVAPGIHRVEDAYTNWYLVEDGDRLTVVDSGVPNSWRSLHAALRELSKEASAIDAVVLTHAHFERLSHSS
ncbi:MAG: MBL fold metallo-hydrolase [Actinobacteria bacterium]|nr:MBL fold metallo-hydrolase [Actinomycetota bacterium]